MKQDQSTDGINSLDRHEEQPLLQRSPLDDVQLEADDATTEVELNNDQLMRLYLSHFLSTWNSRCYEFAAVCSPLRPNLVALASRRQ